MKQAKKLQAQKHRWGVKTTEIEAELYERFGILMDDDNAVSV